MSELQRRLDRLTLRLDHMGMRVEQAVVDALDALQNDDVAAGFDVNEKDSIIDREEVEIEQECIRLLALYQPAAIDLRTICTIIKVNSDLERIADLGAGIARQVEPAAWEALALKDSDEFVRLARDTLELLGRTVRMLGSRDADTARAVIEFDRTIDGDYARFLHSVLSHEATRPGGAEHAMTLMYLARALERIGDLCTNIAEDVIFLQTGDIVRHPTAFERPESQ